MEKRVLVAAGGTGGHISPGIALVRAFQKKKIPVFLLTLEKNRSHSDFTSALFDIFFYEAPPFSKKPLSVLRFPFAFMKSFLYARSILKKLGITHLLAMGGYPCAPVLLAAKTKKIPYSLCEQNAVPGKVTTLFASGAESIFLTFPCSHPSILRASAPVVGNPVRPEFLEKISGSEKKKKSKKFQILVLGGSQGARQLNEMTEKSLDVFSNAEWTLQCGKTNYGELLERLSNRTNLTLLDYVTDIHRYYAMCDLLICRSGAGSLTEGALFGCPMILVPYPFASDNHQMENARVFEKAGAARIINRRDSDNSELIAVIRELMDHPEELERMSKASRSLAKPDAAEKIIEAILKS